MASLNKNKTLFHAIIEKDAMAIQYGTIAYTVYVDSEGNPDINTLKVSKNRRKKYVNK